MSKIGIDKRLRANLIRLRLKAGVDQNSLARKSGVTHIAQIESGRRPIGKDAMDRIAKALGCDIYEFFLPLDARVICDESERVLLKLVDSCSAEGRELIVNILMDFIHYEKISKG